MNNKIFSAIATATLISAAINVASSNMAIANEANNKGITVTIEEAGVQSSQLPVASEYYVVDFSDQSGTSAFDKTNGNTTYSYSNDLEVKEANQWGGADGSKFITQAVLQSIRSYSISVNEDQKYFGFWWSAGDPYNVITFKNDGVDVASFKTADLVDFINSFDSENSSAYFGKPGYDGTETGHENEPYSFVNVFFNGDSAYDEIVVATMTEGGAAFESDNHTFSAVKQTPRGNPLPNLAPIANNDTATTSIYSSVTIDVLENDTDPDNDELTIHSVENVIGGQAKIENNKIVYTAGSIEGEFSFTYTVQDEYGKTDSATVSINVTAVAD